MQSSNVQQVLSDLDDLQMSLDRWYQRMTSENISAHSKFISQLKYLQDIVQGRQGGTTGAAAPTGNSSNPNHNNGGHNNGKPQQGLEWESLLTPSRQQQRPDTPSSMSSPPVSHPISYEALIEDAMSQQAFNIPSSRSKGNQSNPNVLNLSNTSDSRPTPDIGGEGSGMHSHQTPPVDRNMPCQVLVEFKRKRILQFESPYYVAPGEYVVVGGDRGEDIGLVTHSWPHGQKNEAAKWSAGVGLGKVLRVANVLEVSQLQGVQTELELRAVEVAQEKVLEHQLPMRVVDAEYQFDRKKLTFYYQSQHRLDFRNLVRDLYKTFRARIWMEQDVL